METVGTVVGAVETLGAVVEVLGFVASEDGVETVLLGSPTVDEEDTLTLLEGGVCVVGISFWGAITQPTSIRTTRIQLVITPYKFFLSILFPLSVIS